MAKQKKKRTKSYHGSSAAARPTVTRVAAVRRSKSGQWWVDHRRAVKAISLAAFVVVIIALSIVGIVGLFR